MIKRDLILFYTRVQSSNFSSMEVTLDDQSWSFLQKGTDTLCTPSSLKMSHVAWQCGSQAMDAYSSLGWTKVTYNVFLMLSVQNQKFLLTEPHIVGGVTNMI